MRIPRKAAAVFAACVLCALMGVTAVSVSARPAATAQAASTAKTTAQCKKQFKHNTKAQAACIKRVKKGSSGGKCSLEVKWATGNPPSQEGATKDLSVMFKVQGKPAETESAKVQVGVKLLKPQITICSVTISAIQSFFINGVETSHQFLNFSVKMSPHGGLSSAVTLPPETFAPAVVVTARKG